MAVRTINFFGAYTTFRPFILTVDSGADKIVKIPTNSGTYTYNYSVNTSDGQFFNGVTGNLSITFPLANTLYTIEISGMFPKFHGQILTSTEKDKYVDILQFGDVVAVSIADSFIGFSMLKTSATDILKITPSVNSNGGGFMAGTLANLSGLSTLNMSLFTSLNNFLDGSKQANAIDWTDGTNGTINVTDMRWLVRDTPIKSFKADQRSLTVSAGTDWRCPELEVLVLNGRKISIDIRLSPKLLGAGIDALFTSLGTANTGATIPISSLQNASGITTSIATLKGWTIIVS